MSGGRITVYEMRMGMSVGLSPPGVDEDLRAGSLKVERATVYSLAYSSCVAPRRGRAAAAAAAAVIVV